MDESLEAMPLDIVPLVEDDTSTMRAGNQNNENEDCKACKDQCVGCCTQCFFRKCFGWEGICSSEEDIEMQYLAIPNSVVRDAPIRNPIVHTVRNPIVQNPTVRNSIVKKARFADNV